VAKREGIEPLTESERDPEYLALQVKALTKQVEALNAVNRQNLQTIQRAFSMVDMHQQIQGRVTHDIASTLDALKGFVVADSPNYVKMRDGELDMSAYYAEFKQTVTLAGEEYGDAAAILWSQGASPEEAVNCAKLQTEERPEQVEDTEYEVEHFGGSHGKDHRCSG